jgi:hypothetical protein
MLENLAVDVHIARPKEKVENTTPTQVSTSSSLQTRTPLTSEDLIKASQPVVSCIPSVCTLQISSQPDFISGLLA